MDRLRSIVVAGCLLLAACGGRSGIRHAAVDYQDFIRFAGAALLPPGSLVHRVKGYRPTFRLAASHHGHLWLYEANEVAGARTGADLLDLAGKVRHLSVNSGRVELARVKDRPQVAEPVQSVLGAPSGPPEPGPRPGTASWCSTWWTERRSGGPSSLRLVS